MKCHETFYGYDSIFVRGNQEILVLPGAKFVKNGGTLGESVPL